MGAGNVKKRPIDEKTRGRRSFIYRMVRALAQISIRPASTVATLKQDPSFFGYGIGAWLLMGLMYTVTVLIGYLNGFGAVVKPWIPIPAEDYYFWQTFFVIPVFFVVFVVAAGVMQLLARLMGGTGMFEDTFAVVALGSILPTFLFMWLPETLLMVFAPGIRAGQLGGFAFMPPWADAVRQLIVPVWTIAVYVLALARLQSLSIARTVIVVILGMVPAVMVTLVFVR